MSNQNLRCLLAILLLMGPTLPVASQSLLGNARQALEVATSLGSDAEDVADEEGAQNEDTSDDGDFEEDDDDVDDDDD